MRVDLELAGFPVMSPNHRVRLSCGREAEFDIAFVAYMLDVEYHGDYHRERGQWRRDIARTNDVLDDGWDQLAFTGDDLARLPALRERVARRLRRRGWRGPAHR